MTNAERVFALEVARDLAQRDFETSDAARVGVAAKRLAAMVEEAIAAQVRPVVVLDRESLEALIERLDRADPEEHEEAIAELRDLLACPLAPVVSVTVYHGIVDSVRASCELDLTVIYENVDGPVLAAHRDLPFAAEVAS